MRAGRVRWGAIVGGAVAGEILTVIAAFAWVAFYSYVVNPGQPEAAYHAHAETAAPWVSIVAGMPVFYAIGRWWAGSASTALAMFAVYFALDATLIAVAIASAPGEALSIGMIGMIVMSYTTKFVASQLGARRPVVPRTLAT